MPAQQKSDHVQKPFYKDPESGKSIRVRDPLVLVRTLATSVRDSMRQLKTSRRAFATHFDMVTITAISSKYRDTATPKFRRSIVVAC